MSRQHPERSRIPSEMQAHRSLMLLAGSISGGPSRSRRIGSLGVELDMAFVCQTGLPRGLFHQSICQPAPAKVVGELIDGAVRPVLSSRMSNCRCSRAASEGSANVSFSFVDARWHKTKSLGQAPLAQTMLPIRWWHSRRAPSATASPRQYLPASQPFNYHDFVHRCHSRNVMPGQAEKRMRRALHPSTLYPPHSTHPSLCTCELACQTLPMMM
jgi:hypothetical protein